MKMQCNKVGGKKSNLTAFYKKWEGKHFPSLQVKLHPALRMVWDMSNKND